MKKDLLPLVFVITSVFSNNVFSQHPFDELEKAYSEFESKKYKRSAELFEAYFTIYPASPNDLYFAALSNALGGKREKAVEYADKASIGLESYEMMLADPGFKSIYPELTLRRNALRDFYTKWNQSARPRRQQTVFLDSMYTALPFRKLSQHRFAELLRIYSQNQDTSKFFMVVDDILKNTGHGGTAFRWSRSQNIIEGAARRAPESVRKSIVRRNIGRSDLTHAEVHYHASKRDYASVTPALLRLSYEQPEHFTTVLRDRELTEYYKTVEGQRFLRFWIDMNIVPAILRAKVVVVSKEEKYVSTKAAHYGYFRENGFARIAPRSFDEYLSAGEHGSNYLVPRSYLDEVPSHRLSVTIEIVDGKIVLDGAYDGEESEKALLLKPVGASRYADLSGEYAIMSASNIPFINLVQEGKWKGSNMAAIHEKRLKPLTKIRFFSWLEPLTGDDDESLIFAFEANINWLLEILLAPFEENIDRIKKIKILESFKVRSPSMVDHLIRELRKGSDYGSMGEAEKKNYKKLIGAFLRGIPEVIIEQPDFSEIKAIRDELSSIAEKDIEAYCIKKAEKLSSAWAKFKETSPFVLPPFIKHSEVAAQSVDKSFNYFSVIDNDIVFSEYSGKRILAGSEEISLARRRAETVEVQSMTSANEEPLVPLITGGFVGTKGVMVTTSHHVNPSEVGPLVLSQKELDEIQQLSVSLGLRAVRNVQSAGGGFDLRYDRMYAFKAFDKPLVFYHREKAIFAGFLSDPVSFSKNAKVFEDSLSGECAANRNRVFTSTETVHTLNSLKMSPLSNGNIVAMASVSVTSRNSCEPYTPCRIIFKTLDPRLKIIHERIIPAVGELRIDFNSNADISLKVIGDKIFAFIMSGCCGSNPLYMVVFDNDLNVIKPLRDITDEQYKANSLTSLPIVEHDNELYVAYAANIHGESVMELRKISVDGDVSTPAHVALMKGYSRSTGLTKTNDGLSIHYLHEQKDGNVLTTVNVKFEDLTMVWK